MMKHRASKMWRMNIARAIGTWFGWGYVSIAPGTAGSIAALAIAIGLHGYFGCGRGTFLLLAAVFLLPGIWAAGVVAKQVGNTDPQIVVVDEAIGQWITLAGASTLDWKNFLAAFLLFRLLDIWKPPPVRQLEKLPGGIGIVADDVMAGVYRARALFLFGRLRVS